MIEIKRKTEPTRESAQNARENAREAMHQAAAAYHARHDPPQAGADYWEWTIADLQAVSSQHGNHPLIMDLLGAVLADLERCAHAGG